MSPATASTHVGSTTTLAATVRDQNGTVVTNRVVTWASSNTPVATVAGGVVTGIKVGTATITATSEGKSGAAAVTVTAPVPVSAVVVQPGQDTLLANATLQLTALTEDSVGGVLTQDVTWTTNNPSVATVSPTRLVSATSTAGKATITATSEGKNGTSTITVVVPIATVTVPRRQRPFSRATPRRSRPRRGTRRAMFSPDRRSSGLRATPVSPPFPRPGRRRELESGLRP